MAYNIELSNGSSVTIPSNSIVDDQFSIPLIGRNWSGYGDYAAIAFLHILENFSHDTPPANPTPGQLWHNSSDDKLSVRDAANENWLQLLTIVDDVLEICGDIIPCENETYNIGSSALRWDQVYGNYFHGVAQSAEYADLAERYEADKIYESGTVVKIGGEKEITETTEDCDMDVFSVISTAPGVAMNSNAGKTETHPYVVLTGRVPVKVKGKVKKGNRLVTSDQSGVARAIMTEDYQRTHIGSSIIGRALEDKDNTDEGLILAFVSANK